MTGLLPKKKEVFAGVLKKLTWKLEIFEENQPEQVTRDVTLKNLIVLN